MNTTIKVINGRWTLNGRDHRDMTPFELKEICEPIKFADKVRKLCVKKGFSIHSIVDIVSNSSKTVIQGKNKTLEM